MIKVKGRLRDLTRPHSHLVLANYIQREVDFIVQFQEVSNRTVLGINHGRGQGKWFYFHTVVNLIQLSLLDSAKITIMIVFSRNMASLKNS